MPSKNSECDYFTDERKIHIDRKDFGNIEGQLMAALHNMKLLDYAIQKKVDREIEGPKPQVILTSAQAGFKMIHFEGSQASYSNYQFENPCQLQTDDNRTMQDIALNPKIDPSRKFQKNFMSQPVDVIKSHMVNDEPVPQLHRAVKHKFILSKSYDENTHSSKRNSIITSDPKKNELVIALLKEFVADRKAIMIFVERKIDSENLGWFL